MASFYLILFPTVPTTGFPEIQLDMFLHLSTSMACTSLIPCFKNQCHSPCVNSIHSSKSILSLTFSMEPPFISLALIDHSLFSVPTLVVHNFQPRYWHMGIISGAVHNCLCVLVCFTNKMLNNWRINVMPLISYAHTYYLVNNWEYNKPTVMFINR